MYFREMKFTVIAFFAFLFGATAQENNETNSSDLLESDVNVTQSNESRIETEEISENNETQILYEKHESNASSVEVDKNDSLPVEDSSDDENKSKIDDQNDSSVIIPSKNLPSVIIDLQQTNENPAGDKVATVTQQKPCSDCKPSSSTAQGTNYWSVSLLIILLAVLVIKVILSQGEIKRLNLRVDDLSSGLSTLDQKTWEKLTSTLEKIQSDDAGKASVSLSASKAKEEKSHALQLAVFNEIERIEARLTKYDESDKNRKPMMKALERLEETLSELGYEREKLIGAKYVEGKKYIPRFITSKDPAHETPTITRVYKPSILFNGKLIQQGEVEVSECG